MSRLSVSERMRVASLTADQSRRAALSRLLYSPFLRWRYGAPAADQLLIVPQDLRTADPSFWHEVVLDHFGLAGTVAALDGRSPFDVRPPHQAWAQALHGFGWLRHFAAAGHEEARAMACRLAVDWVIRSARAEAKPAWLPQVTARRVISWISHSNVILDGANQKTYDIVAGSLGQQLVRLSAEWRDTPGGYPRLLVLTALVLAGLAISGQDKRLAEAEKAFVSELQKQILPDGGHISRNPRILVELMLDLLPLRQCFAARGRALPPGMNDAMQRMLTMLRYLRLGDGRLVRFNGTGVAASAGLATVLAYDERPSQSLAAAKHSNYVRLERGSTILIVDSGAPPPLEYAGEAYAGCLSFELSSGTELLLVNGGAPAPVDAGWRAAARATASHNTLCLSETSSARLVRHKRLEAIIGAPPIAEPERVEFKVQERDGHALWAGQHDGYFKRFGLRHSRRIVVSQDGRRIEGTDRLKDPLGSLHLTHDLPFAIHFRPHPDVLCQRLDAADAAQLTLCNGETWTLTVGGKATLALEEGTFFADSTGPTRILQLIARGTTAGDTTVTWVLERKPEAVAETMPSDIAAVVKAMREIASTGAAIDAAAGEAIERIEAAPVEVSGTTERPAVADSAADLASEAVEVPKPDETATDASPDDGAASMLPPDAAADVSSDGGEQDGERDGAAAVDVETPDADRTVREESDTTHATHEAEAKDAQGVDDVGAEAATEAHEANGGPDSADETDKTTDKPEESQTKDET